jgi:hypothetical protein
MPRSGWIRAPREELPKDAGSGEPDRPESTKDREQRERCDKRVDVESEDSFPASDPPSRGVARMGTPRRDTPSEPRTPHSKIPVDPQASR